MTYSIPDALWSVEFENVPGPHGRALRFIFRLPAAGGPALWAAYVLDGYLPVHLPLRALTTSEWTHLVIR